ncbi:MAG: uroporphyrinogen-III synthase [Euryarchaeota archaeon]|nr:uroporphyrinogen-III synthase [Euryarchaeota archaeon]
MKVAITRPREKARETAELAASYGFEALIVSALELVPRSEEEVRRATGRLEDYDWVVVTSAYGAELMCRYFGDELRRARIAVVGEKTEAALRRAGIRAALIPREFRSEGLVEALREAGAGGRVLVARASAGREVLLRELEKFASVREVHLYDHALPRDRSSILALREALLRGEVAAVVFTSARTVENVFEVLGDGLTELLNRVRVVAIAPGTRSALLKRGVEQVAMPERYTLEACLELLKEG